MTMENEIAKRNWIKELWEETRGDEAARDFLFGGVIEDLEGKIEDELRFEVEGQIREEVEEEMTDNPPATVRAALIKEFMDDTPEELREKIRADVSEALDEKYQDQIQDLRATIESLQSRLSERDP